VKVIMMMCNWRPLMKHRSGPLANRAYRFYIKTINFRIFTGLEHFFLNKIYNEKAHEAQ